MFQKVAPRYVIVTLLSRYLSSVHTLTFNQVARLQFENDALIKIRVTIKEDHKREVTATQGRIYAAYEQHKSELASRALGSALMESGLAQALASNRARLDLETSRLQSTVDQSTALFRRNSELEAQVKTLRQLVDRQVQVSSLAAASTSASPTLEAHELAAPQLGPSRSNPNYSHRQSPPQSTGIKIFGASKTFAQV